jgi:hypothetical protein
MASTVVGTPGQPPASMRQVPAGVAQLAEQPPCKRQVSGSNPLTGSPQRPTLPPQCSPRRWPPGGQHSRIGRPPHSQTGTNHVK